MLETSLEIPRQYITEVREPRVFRVLNDDGSPGEAYEVGYKPAESELLTLIGGWCWGESSTN